MKRQFRNSLGKGTEGNALIEFSLLLPWLILLFTATFDFGFYAYALVSVENAARAAAIHASTNMASATDQAASCAIVIDTLRGLPNIGQSFHSACDGDPVTVTAVYCDDVTPCQAGSLSADSGSATLITVTYQMPPLFRFPLPGLRKVTRSAEMRLQEKTL